VVELLFLTPILGMLDIGKEYPCGKLISYSLLIDCVSERVDLTQASVNKLQSELAVLQEQKMAQQDKIDVDTRHRQEWDAAFIAKFQQLARQVSESKDVILTLERRAKEAESMAANANCTVSRFIF
jgi:hypothetical protein